MGTLFYFSTTLVYILRSCSGKLSASYKFVRVLLSHMLFKNCPLVYYFVWLPLLCLTLNGCLLPEDSHPTFSENLSLEKAAICNAQLGFYYLKKDNIQHAKIKLLKAYQQAPQLPIVKSAMACFLERVGEVKACEIHHLQAIELNQTSGMMHHHYGEFLLRQKRYQEAQFHFLVAVRDLKYLDTAHAYANAALCFIKIADYNKAIYYLSKALNHNPLLKEVHLNLIQLHYRQKHYRQAEKALQEYTQLHGKIGNSELKIGLQIALALKDTVKANEYIKTLDQKYSSSSKY